MACRVRGRIRGVHRPYYCSRPLALEVDDKGLASDSLDNGVSVVETTIGQGTTAFSSPSVSVVAREEREAMRQNGSWRNHHPAFKGKPAPPSLGGRPARLSRVLPETKIFGFSLQQCLWWHERMSRLVWRRLYWKPGQQQWSLCLWFIF